MNIITITIVFPQQQESGPQVAPLGFTDALDITKFWDWLLGPEQMVRMNAISNLALMTRLEEPSTCPVHIVTLVLQIQ